MPAKTSKSHPKSEGPSKTQSDGFSAEERAAMKERAAELRAEGKKGAKKAEGLQAVLDPGDGDVIGCVYIYPSRADDWDITVQSWVRADRAELDVPVADAVARWLATDWPWKRIDRCGR